MPTSARAKRRRHKYTQDYPSERKDYDAGGGVRRLPGPQPAGPVTTYHPVQGNPDDGGKISPAEAERISSEDLPGEEGPEENDEGPSKAA